MSLYKRGHTWWSYRYIDGVRRQRSTETTNRRQAELIEQKFKAEDNARRYGVVEADPDLTFGALAARFIANGGVRPHHLDRLKLLLPYFSEISVVRINKGAVTDYRQHRHSEKTVSEATVNRDVSVLRHLLYWGIDEGLLLANPLARVKMARERKVRRPVVSIAEEQALLAAAPPHLRRMIIAALDTGMRRGEILSQLREHVDFSRRLLFVTRSKTPEGEAREIPLTKRLYELLKAEKPDPGIIFGFRNHPIARIKTVWKSTLKKAQVRHIRFHDLRHTFNTRLLEAGVLAEVRMALMGHSNRDRVHATYTHVELPLKREAISKLEAWVEKQEQQLKGGSDGSSKAT